MTPNRILELKASAAKTQNALLNEALDEIIRLRRLTKELAYCIADPPAEAPVLRARRIPPPGGPT